MAFITGGAGGVGLGIARALAEAGMRLAMVDVEEDALEVAGRVLAESGADVSTFACDVSEADSIARAIHEAGEHLGPLHLLVNSAGVAMGGRFQSYSQEDWQWILGVNLMGVVGAISAFLPQARMHGQGAHIVNVGALSSLWPIPLSSAYNASKGAVLALSESLARELEPEGIGVSIVLPAAVPSGLEESERNRPDRFGPAGQSQEHNQAMKARRARPAPQALDALIVGKRMVEAVLGNELFVFTHRDWRGRLEEKLGALSAGLDGADESPALAGTVGLGVTEFDKVKD
ncbi:MAG: SDR family NAD(P)-dependent oxidoreductase [Rhodospirillales bacterium]|nr:SDR family NAD(P)-dependent oxidoreductase [Rhodospirillales bacterium]